MAANNKLIFFSTERRLLFIWCRMIACSLGWDSLANRLRIFICFRSSGRAIGCSPRCRLFNSQCLSVEPAMEAFAIRAVYNLYFCSDCFSLQCTARLTMDDTQTSLNFALQISGSSCGSIAQWKSNLSRNEIGFNNKPGITIHIVVVFRDRVSNTVGTTRAFGCRLLFTTTRVYYRRTEERVQVTQVTN